MVTDLLTSIANLVIGAVNALIAGLGAVLSALISALPSMPALPTLPDSMVTAESWVAWVFPVSTLIEVLTFVSTMYLLWNIVAIGLRWAKGIGGAD